MLNLEAKTEAYQQKIHSENRILVLRVKEGMKPVDVTGLLDKRLFTGEPNLHAIRGPFDNMWRLKYTHGVLPQPLRQQFTNFRQLVDHCKGYFSRRNIEIVEVIDDYESSNFR